MATPTFSTMPDVDIPRSTWLDVRRHRGQQMAAIQTGSGNNRCRATLGHVVSGISESGVVANVGVDVEIASPSLSVQTLFLLPVCVVARSEDFPYNIDPEPTIFMQWRTQPGAFYAFLPL